MRKPAAVGSFHLRLRQPLEMAFIYRACLWYTDDVVCILDSLFFEPPLDSGLTEMTALFFGITAPVVLDQEQKLDYKNNLLNQWARFFCSLLFVFLCLYYGYIYIRLFHGGVLSEEEIGAYNTIVWFLGIICCILVAGSRFVEGFVDDAE